jgi:GT2 family glycosyltransferase
MTQRELEPDWLSGSCILARREALLSVGGFDQGFFLYEEDADLCRRLRRAGWRVLLTPEAEIVHRLGSSMAKAPARARLEYQRSHLRYYQKHNGTAARGLLRGLMAGSALLGLARALVRGGHEERKHQASVLRLALGLG